MTREQQIAHGRWVAARAKQAAAEYARQAQHSDEPLPAMQLAQLMLAVAANYERIS